MDPQNSLGKTIFYLFFHTFLRNGLSSCNSGTVESRLKKDFGSDQNLSSIEILYYFKHEKIPIITYIDNR